MTSPSLNLILDVLLLVCVCFEHALSLRSRCEHFAHYSKKGRTCSCRPGYVISKRDPSRCLDINECNSRRHDPPCEQICINTPGSYSCSCESGYTISKTNQNECRDINECKKHSPCEQLCTNTIGGYSCSCKSGYAISETNPNRCSDINECARTSDPVCEQICTNKPGGFRCSCREGYKINATDPTSCVDVDECSGQTESPCHHTCTNTIGSYSCSCDPGYSVSETDTSTCTAQCNAYSSKTSKIYKNLTNKACFEMCAANPSCYSYIYKVGTSCELKLVTGDVVDTENSDLEVNPYIRCQNVSGDCSAYSSIRLAILPYNTHKDCFDSCMVTPLCVGYEYSKKSNSCNHYILDGTVTDINTDKSTSSFVRCSMLNA
ncbi:fibulin-1-like [Physella acuta]|uniref:fibulin-1-like n=1 Tax=Physella acuta TaxID=109671 RepID=UPI0027DB1FA3|nr:fibulin-1-like [Physella acuta]